MPFTRTHVALRARLDATIARFLDALAATAQLPDDDDDDVNGDGAVRCLPADEPAPPDGARDWCRPAESSGPPGRAQVEGADGQWSTVGSRRGRRGR